MIGYVGYDQQLEQVQRAIHLRHNVLVDAAARVGLSGFLREAARQLTTRDSRDVVHVDVRGHSSADGILDAIAAEVGALQGAPGGNALDRLEAIADAVASRVEGEQVVVLEAPTGIAGHALFGQLRDLLWEVPCLWVVGARSAAARMLAMPPADAFFETRIALHPLDVNVIAQIVAARNASLPLAACLAIARTADGDVSTACRFEEVVTAAVPTPPAVDGEHAPKLRADHGGGPAGQPWCDQQSRPDCLELRPDMNGGWLIATRHTLHLWDLQAMLYTRIPGPHAQTFALDGERCRIARVVDAPSSAASRTSWSTTRPE